MEIRGIRESELEEMINLQCLVFRPDGHERYRQYVRRDSSYRYDQSRVVVVDGRIVATLRVWERRMRIGSCIVRMGGIGGVGTHPDYRGVGYATALMKDTIAYMRTVGYELGVLFSAIPCEFYRKLGWASVPLEGFRVTRRRTIELGETASDSRDFAQFILILGSGLNWQVKPFDEGRDLEQVIALYDACNAQQSGSLVRTQSYWDSGPARIRNILPTVVARRQDTLGGYLNFQIEGKIANVLEVATNQADPGSLVALANQLLQVCEGEGVEEIHGEIPHRHPLVDLLVEGGAGDLFLTGNSSMMLYAVKLPALFQLVLPELQSRLDASNQKFAPISICFEINNQEAVLRLHDDGTLQIFNTDENAIRLTLPGPFFWRALLSESSWHQLEPTLHARGISVTPEISTLLSILFPQQEVIFWSPDHY